MRKLVVATTNRGKIKEIAMLLDSAPVSLMTLADFPDVSPPDETGETFAENARLKALFYAAHTGELTVAEDSGLEVDALDGAPGVESARFGGADATYPQKFALLYDALGQKKMASPATARFVCALALAKGRELLFEARGTVEGAIAPEPRGTGGFGYDPIFFYPPYGCTLAEAGDRKTAVSHRGEAFRKLRAYLTTYIAEHAEHAE